jgi:hypothetical protein
MICSTLFGFNCHTYNFIFLFSTNTFDICISIRYSIFLCKAGAEVFSIVSQRHTVQLKAHNPKFGPYLRSTWRRIPKTQLCIGQKVTRGKLRRYRRSREKSFFPSVAHCYLNQLINSVTIEHNCQKRTQH